MDTAEEMTRLRSQNNQLCKTTQKQRVVIQCLQQRNLKLATERNRLEEKVGSLERRLRKKHVTSCLIAPDAIKEMVDTASDSPDSTSPVEGSDSDEDNQRSKTSPELPSRSLQRKPRQTEEQVTRMATGTQLQRWRPRQLALNVSSRSPSNAIIENDAQLYARYQSTVQKKKNPQVSESTNLPPVSPSSADLSSSAAPRKDATKRQSMIFTPRIEVRKPYLNSDFKDNQENEEEDDEEEDDEEISFLSVTNCGARQERLESIIANSSREIQVSIIGVSLKVNENEKDVVSFIISISHGLSSQSEVPDDTEELWRVEKLYSDFLRLDAKLKAQADGSLVGRICRLPKKQLFASQTSNKIDQRKEALERYLRHVVSLPISDKSNICEFLSEDVVTNGIGVVRGQMTKIRTRKEGYLKKRGKNFGGWKTRYFVLRDTTLDYYDSKDGTKLGAIRLSNAFIGRQAPPLSPGTDELASSYRHALLIVEQKRPGHPGSVRHILCARSDEERNGWCESLTQNVSTEETSGDKRGKRFAKLRKLSKGGIRAVTATPTTQYQQDCTTDIDKMAGASTLRASDQEVTEEVDPGLRSISPTSGDRARQLNARSTLAAVNLNSHVHPEPSMATDHSRAVSPTFNDSDDSIAEKKHKTKANQYLDAKNAVMEEGIYRLSGSNMVIQTLKQKFDQEGDVNLLACGEEYDIHAIAGLLKLWLRELPSNVLTYEREKQFMRVIGMFFKLRSV
ncbi:hypothetical protein DFQ29_002745 [Apophysomyces sp. BC1021]|nr:hypothetical protein DFQ29_002745 [Apophysomyces sp. BC1021]